MHTGKETFKCSSCEYTCHQKGHLKDHEMMHTGEKNLKNVKIHQQAHEYEGKRYDCYYCSRDFSHKSNLSTHEQTHTRGKKHFDVLATFTDECGMKMSKRNILMLDFERESCDVDDELDDAGSDSETGASDGRKHVGSHLTGGDVSSDELADAKVPKIDETYDTNAINEQKIKKIKEDISFDIAKEYHNKTNLRQPRQPNMPLMSSNFDGRMQQIIAKHHASQIIFYLPIGAATGPMKNPLFQQPKVIYHNRVMSLPMQGRALAPKPAPTILPIILKNHEMTHTGEKPFKCSSCEYTCRWKSGLKNHEMTHTGEKPFKCSSCEYTCRRKAHLKNHEMIHTGKKPFKCSTCEYTCRKKFDLKDHEMTHTNKKPFKCSSCEYTCRRKAHLKNHERMHTGEKPFKCSTCEYTCCQKSTLKRHERTYTGKETFKCSSCEYTCHQKSHLKDHEMMHTGVKTFKNVKLHQQAQEDEGKRYDCYYCDHDFSHKSNLSTHEQTHTHGKKTF